MLLDNLPSVRPSVAVSVYFLLFSSAVLSILSSTGLLSICKGICCGEGGGLYVSRDVLNFACRIGPVLFSCSVFAFPWYTHTLQNGHGQMNRHNN